MRLAKLPIIDYSQNKTRPVYQAILQYSKQKSRCSALTILIIIY